MAQSSLMVLDLYNNTIQGAIPDCILNGTSKLQYIRLGMVWCWCGREGIACTIYTHLELVIVHLHLINPPPTGFNEFSGSIPDVFAPNTPLAWLTVPSNQLTGSIPASISNLSNIYMLNFTSNALSGTIPDSIGNAPYLMHVLARNNNITGTIPQSLATSPTLITIDLRNNMVCVSVFCIVSVSISGVTCIHHTPPDMFLHTLNSHPPSPPPSHRLQGCLQNGINPLTILVHSSCRQYVWLTTALLVLYQWVWHSCLVCWSSTWLSMHSSRWGCGDGGEGVYVHAYLCVHMQHSINMIHSTPTP